MMIRESRWLGEQLQQLPDGDLGPLLDVGSQTEEFRTTTQPHIDEHIFRPLRQRGVDVVHLDLQDAPGVDMVGDLCDPAFLEKLKASRFRSVMLSNILEHVSNPEDVAAAALEVVPSGGYLIISGPHCYPYHPEPIDTMFRPTVQEAHHMFPGTEIASSSIIDGGNWRTWNSAEGGRSLGRTLVRLCTPFYRPRQWWLLARRSPFLIRHKKAFAMVLKKH